jgi:hypothetical protein
MKTASVLSTSVENAIHRFCEGLATPTSLATSLLVKYGEWDQLATRRVDPALYSSSEDYLRDVLSVELLRKMEDLPTSFDRKAVALRNFHFSEKKCLVTNRRLAPYLDSFSGLVRTNDVEPGVHEFIARVRKIVASILGPCPDVIDGRFGPGATYGDRGKLTTIPDKMSSKPTLTSGAWAYSFPWSGTLWAKACSVSDRKLEFVRGNRFTTVPKDCEKDRGICIEPSLNVFYQLGYGRVMRGRLKKIGIDLKDGQLKHRQVACAASKDRSFCTIDLSNASDTICRNLVSLLLPEKWQRVLFDLRSSRTEIEGRWHLLEKFSSMGNGFTFELETLLFLSIILGLSSDDHKLSAGRNVFVYGDDIIVPTNRSKDVIAALSFFGFEVNKRKTFVDGPFKESCGGDYFDGLDVRPYYLKESPSEPQQLMSLANGIRALSDKHPFLSVGLRRAWFCILDALPSHLRTLRGPRELGDLVICDEESQWQVRWRSGIRYVRCYRPARYNSVSWKYFNPDVTLAAAVYGVPWNNGEIIPRNSVAGYKLGWVPFS